MHLDEFLRIYKNRVPSEYEEVAYIESSGTQYIDTGVYLNGDGNKAEIEYEFDSSVEAGYKTLFGAQNNQNLMTLYTGSGYACGNSTIGVVGRITSNVYTYGHHTISFEMANNKAIYILDNDTPKEISISASTFVDTSLETRHQVALCSNNNGGNHNQMFKGKIYKFRFWKQGNLIRDFIPVKKKSNNEYGMYDTVSQDFFGNAGTTGAFTGGNPVYNELKTIGDIWQRGVSTESTKDATTTINNSRKCVNLLNESTIDLGHMISDTGNYQVNSMSACSDYIAVKPNTTYYIKYNTDTSASSFKTRIHGYSSAKVWQEMIYSTSVGVKETSFTTNSNTEYVRLSIGNNPTEVMLNEGSTAQPYYPYFSPTQVAPSIKAYGGTVQEIAPDLWGRYVPVEYIQSSGTQYIDTDYKLKMTDTVKLKVQIETLKSSVQFIFGSRGQTNNNYYQLYYGTAYSKGGRLAYGRNTLSSGDFIDINLLENSMYEFEIASGLLNINGSSISDMTISNVDALTNLGLFARKNNDDTWTGQSSIKMYYFQILDNTHSVVHNFIPVKDTTNNTYGMYDTVEGKFYGNDGTGAFTAGPEIKRVQYIESGGSQYITLPVKYNSANKYTIDTKFNIKKQAATVYSGWDAGGLFGIDLSGKYSDGNNLTQKISIDNKNVILNQIINSGTDTQTVSNLTVDGTDYSYSRQHASLATYANDSDYPFLCWYSSSKYETSKGLAGKIYYFRLKINDILTANLIPVLIGTEYCILDTVEWIVYRNKGTGSFTGGSEIPNRLLNPYALKGNRGEIKYGIYSKNLFDKTAITVGKYLNNTGEEIATLGWNISDYMPVEGGETYYQRLRTAGTSPRTCWYDANKQFISAVVQLAGGTQTAPLNAAYCRMSINSQSSSASDVDYAMFTKGSTAPTEYEPYRFGLHADGSHLITTYTNLAFNEHHNQQLSQTDGVTFTDNPSVNVTNYIKVKNRTLFIGGATTGSARVFKYGQNHTFIDATTLANFGQSISFDSSVEYIRLQYNYTSGGVRTENIMVTIGTAAVPYVPYIEPIETEITDLLYNKNDYVDIQAGKRYNVWNAFVLPKTGWIEDTTFYAHSYTDSLANLSKGRTNGLCTHFVVGNYLDTQAGIIAHSGYAYVTISKATFASLNDLTKFLTENDVILVAECQNSTETTIATQPISLATKGSKTITAQAEIPVTVQAKALQK